MEIEKKWSSSSEKVRSLAQEEGVIHIYHLDLVLLPFFFPNLFWKQTPGMKRTDTSLGMKDNSESALSTNKEAISNATRNLMESLILAQDERWWHA